MPLVGAATFRGTQINIYTTTDKKGRLIVNAKDSSATVFCTFSIPRAEVATADVKARVQSKLSEKYPLADRRVGPDHTAAGVSENDAGPAEETPAAEPNGAGEDAPAELSGLFGDVESMEAEISAAVESEASGARRTGRQRPQVARFDASQSLTSRQCQRLDSRGTGHRWQPDETKECSRPGCVKVRLERDELKRVCDQQAAELRELRDDFRRVNMDAGLDDRETTAAEHLQQGLLEMLDDQEEIRVRVRLDAGRLALSVLVHREDEPASAPAEDEEPSEPEASPQPPGPPLPPPPPLPWLSPQEWSSAGFRYDGQRSVPGKLVLSAATLSWEGEKEEKVSISLQDITSMRWSSRSAN
eukprot:6133275-Prymnesium_polylepis.1